MPPIAVAIFTQGVHVTCLTSGRSQGCDHLLRLQVERVFGFEQKGRTFESCRLQKLNRIFFGLVSVPLEQEDQDRVANVDLVPVAKLLLLDGDAVDQGSITAFQVLDGELAVIANQHAMPAR